jgi:hypothetical protein
MYMATARVLTTPDQLVNINRQGQASPAGVQIANGQSVQFNNNSGSPISITFSATAISNQTVFNDINNLASGASYTEAPLVANITVNYNVSMNNDVYGPFAIEVGTGQLEISVTAATPTPRIGAIPPNGEIQFNATDHQCTITWQNSDPFTPALNDVYVGQANNQVGAENGNSGKNFNYTLAPSAGAVQTAMIHPLGGGGGTIKVT